MQDRLTELGQRHRDSELRWTDPHGDHGGVVGFDEMRLEQPDAPPDAVALVEAGHKVPSPTARYTRRGKMVLDSHPHDRHIEADAAYLTAQQAVDAALILLDSAAAWRAEQAPSGGPQGPVADDDHDRRWRLHVHAASIHDMTFWIERLPDGTFRAIEIESGCAGEPGATDREAMDNYWRMVER